MKIGDLELNLNHFFRYVYSGFILCLIIILVLSEQSGKLYLALGGNKLQSNTFLLFLLVAIGTGLYVFYKAGISEFIIDSIHFKKPGFFFMHSKEDCVFEYLKNLIPDKKDKLAAFRLIRDIDFDFSIRERFHLRHSEIHVLYITFTACVIGLLVRLVVLPFKIPACGEGVWFSILLVGLISFACGIYSDKKLCADECYYSKLNEKEIKETLKKAKLLKDNQEK